MCSSMMNTHVWVLTLCEWVASEVVNYVYIKVIYTIRTRHLVPLKAIARAARREYRHLKHRRLHSVETTVRRARLFAARGARDSAEAAFERVLYPYRGYLAFLSARWGLPMGTGWLALVAAVRRGVRAA